MTVKSFMGGAVPTTLAVGIDEVGLALTGVAFTGWPDGSNGPFNVILDKDTVNEEKCLAASIGGGATMTLVQRGYDGTTPHAHSVGCKVEHGWFGIDAAEANKHDNADDSVHGLGPTEGGFVGTAKAQILTNKTMSGDANVFTDIPPTAIPTTSAAIVTLTNTDASLQAQITSEGTQRVSGDATEAAARVAADNAHAAAGDPHSQYLTAAEGNAAYDPINAAGNAVSNHIGGDPHPQYLTPAEGNAAYDPINAAANGDAAHVAAANPHPSAIGRVASGKVTSGLPGAVPGATSPLTVTLPAGKFSTTPQIVATVESSASAPVFAMVAAPNAVTFQIVTYQLAGSGIARNISWFAHL